MFPLPLFSYSSFHFATNLINLNRSTVFICIIKSTNIRSQSNEFSLEAIEMEVIEKNWYFLCSNSERNEQHCEGSCGTEKVLFVVHTSENEFQTRRHEWVNHKELAKSVERTTPGAIRMNKNWGYGTNRNILEIIQRRPRVYFVYRKMSGIENQKAIN